MECMLNWKQGVSPGKSWVLKVLDRSPQPGQLLMLYTFEWSKLELTCLGNNSINFFRTFWTLKSSWSLDQFKRIALRFTWLQLNFSLIWSIIWCSNIEQSSEPNPFHTRGRTIRHSFRFSLFFSSLYIKSFTRDTAHLKVIALNSDDFPALIQKCTELPTGWLSVY